MASSARHRKPAEQFLKELGFTEGHGHVYLKTPAAPGFDQTLAVGSKHPDGISSPLKTRLSKPKKIWPRLCATKVNINPQISNVVVKLCHPRRAQDLVARLSEQPDFIGSFLAPNRKIEDQVPNLSRNFQTRLARLRLALPAGHGSLTKIQDGCVRPFHRVSGSHPQPSPHREEQNSSGGHQHKHPSALDRRLPPKLLKFLEARTA